MNDSERIERMYTNGVITRQEADRLLRAVKDVDGTTPPAIPAAPVHPDVPVLHVRGALQALIITVEPGLSKPLAHGYTVQDTAEGASVTMSEGGFIEDVLNVDRGNPSHIELPAGWGVDFKVGAGSVSINGPVAFVSGSLAAGELRIEETAGIDINQSAGDVQVGLLATSGAHRINLGIGSVQVRFLPGSYADVDAAVNLGGIRARGALHVEDGLGARARGTIGAGVGTSPAHLSLRVKTGDIRLRNEGN